MHPRPHAEPYGPPPSHAAPAPPPRQPWSVLVLLSIAQFMVTLDVTAGIVALPSISRALPAVPPVRPAPAVKAALH